MALKVLLVSRERSSSNSLTEMLEKKGYSVLKERNSKKVVRQAAEGWPDLIVVDATTFKRGSKSLCRSLRKKAEAIPILLILDEDERDLDDVVDAYLPTPFTSRKLTYRIKKAIRNRGEPVISVGDLTLDLRRRIVQSAAGEHKLTPKQFGLLRLFMKNLGQVLTRKRLMKEVWETDYLGDTRTLDVHVRWVREKIEEDPSKPRYLRTVRGVGYRFDVPSEMED